ncbi:flagellar hook protein FlgE [uncultured Gilvimarinus sp.]|uniref:flagellar hook protein FlgE n=1 Tax=uncultured Gilvimarinus sp. TaxID=1689143 RepID=UPI0030EE8EB7|tara:strand:- start:343 stop:1578 length:1236 start_codon:yes stop_codon:yes gene_type:complete
MPFNTALSGIRAANTDLKVTGNNIANASTTGFKNSRAEFGDVYASSLLGSGSNTPGAGVNLQKIRQQFSQGNLNFTENQLDLAINGAGMFILDNAGDKLYGRDGTFGLDKDGYIVNNTGSNLQGFIADDEGNVGGILEDLRVDVENQAPKATTELDLSFNLDAREAALDPAEFDPSDPATYNNATSATVYDSLGNSHTLSQYFVKTGDNTWDVYPQVDGEDLAAPADPIAISFDENGAITTEDANGVLVPTSFALSYDPGNGAAPADIEIDYANSTQYGSGFSVEALSQDGYTTGRLAGIDIDEQGLIFARFTNGEAQTIGQVALASFNNLEALKPVGSTLWAQTADSGELIVGAPGSASFGDIQAGALEESNVDLSEQLVNLIIAQRNFQANSKTIETANQTTQTIINLR